MKCKGCKNKMRVLFDEFVCIDCGINCPSCNALLQGEPVAHGEKLFLFCFICKVCDCEITLDHDEKETLSVTRWIKGPPCKMCSSKETTISINLNTPSFNYQCGVCPFEMQYKVKGLE